MHRWLKDSHHCGFFCVFMFLKKTFARWSSVDLLSVRFVTVLSEGLI
ncbi:hypothetical protein EEDFHM_00591 [Methylorubrum populi]